MPPRSSDRISQEALCEIAGVTVSARREWAKRKRLREAGRAKYGERDAIELAALRALMECLGPTDAPIAWDQIKKQVSSASRNEQLVAIFDRQDKAAAVESSIRGLRARLVYGHPTTVVDLAEPIARVRLAFFRLLQDT